MKRRKKIASNLKELVKKSYEIFKEVKEGYETSEVKQRLIVVIL